MVVKGQTVKILEDGRPSEYFTGRVGVVEVASGDVAVVTVTLRSGRKVRWIGTFNKLECVHENEDRSIEKKPKGHTREERKCQDCGRIKVTYGKEEV